MPLNQTILENLDRALLQAMEWVHILVTEDGPGGRSRVPVWIPRGLSSEAELDVWLDERWEWPVWEVGEVPQFSTDSRWADELEVDLRQSGYQIRFTSTSQFLRCRITGTGRNGCFTAWAGQGWPMDKAFVLSMAVYHAWYGSEQLQHVEGLLVVA